MTEQQDKELERYLDGGSPASRAYAQLADEQPPADVDAKILAAAEREVKVTGIDAKRPPPFKAFAWAAVFVVSFSLVLNIVFDPAVQDPAAEFNGTPAQAPATSVADAPDELELKAQTAAPTKARARAPEGLIQEMRTAPPADTDSQEALVRRAAPDAEIAFAARSPSPEEAAVRDRVLQILIDHRAQTGGSADAAVDIDSERRLSDILTAFGENRDDEAYAALADFRETYPEHPVTTALVAGGL